MTAQRVSATEVRAAIARTWLSAHPEVQLGTIALRQHQCDAVARLHALFRDARGAMLADDVGLGKTYTALATARHAKQLIVVAPAALRSMWRGALQRTHLAASILSFEALSRGAVEGVLPDFVIVDEAHHARTATTQCYRALAMLCADATVLLLTATPVHNRVGELRTQLALFLGERAWAAPEDELTRYIVKREAGALTTTDAPVRIPDVDGVHWLDAGDDEELLDQILALPPCVPPADGGDGGALLTISLVRQWASSRAALRVALRRRLARGNALAAALACGRYPTHAQLHAWQFAEGTLQLAFPEIVSDSTSIDTGALGLAIEAHRTAAAVLLAQSEAGADPDDHRANALRDVRQRHPGEHIIVFAESTATVEALYARLVRDGGVAMLTSRGGLVAGGRISRRELLEQFAPDAERKPTANARCVTLLVATDVLSEGVNLQRASVIVHADLPWSPARFEQRVGRVRRMGTRHTRVSVYALRPPAGTERLVRIESRLREKIAVASHALGVAGTILPRLFSDVMYHRTHPTTDDVRLSQALAAWQRPYTKLDHSGPLVAAVSGACTGLLAAVDLRGRPTLIADLGEGLSQLHDVVVGAVHAAAGGDAPLDDEPLRNALARVHAWVERHATATVVDLSSNATARARRQLLYRIDAIATRGPRHLRAGLIPAVQEARRIGTTIFGAGAERVLEELADAHMPDAAWLQAVCTFVKLHARGDAVAHDHSRVLALCLLIGSRAHTAPAREAIARAAAAPPP